MDPTVIAITAAGTRHGDLVILAAILGAAFLAALALCVILHGTNDELAKENAVLRDRLRRTQADARARRTLPDLERAVRAGMSRGSRVQR